MHSEEDGSSDMKISEKKTPSWWQGEEEQEEGIGPRRQPVATPLVNSGENFSIIEAKLQEC